MKFFKVLLLSVLLFTGSVSAGGCDYKLKEGVSFEKLHPSMGIFIHEASCIFESFVDMPLTITSTTEGKHHKDSKHYLGLAIDIRTWGIKKPKLERLVGVLRNELPGYTYVIEDTHLHVQAKGLWL